MDKFDLHLKAIELRNDLGEDTTSPIDIFSLVKTISNLTLIFYPMQSSLSGICVKNDNNPFIAINSSMSLGRQRFSLAHELYHLYYDQNSHITISSQKIGNDKEIEKQADCFASFFLLPENALLATLKKLNVTNITINEIVYLEQLYGMSRQAILYRLLINGYIDPQMHADYSVGVIKSAKKLGYDDVLYKPMVKEKLYMTYGKYINLANKLYDDEIISTGKYESLLLQAFRDDLIYGSTDADGELND